MAQKPAIRLIAGLGNPGPRYEDTAHNAGFWFVDALAKGAQFRPETKFMGEALQHESAGQSVWLFKPGAFINRSGLPLKLISDYYKIPLEQILVVHDDLDLPPGTVKLKFDGGHGGHNGLRDIFSHLGKSCWRLRIGVGHPGDRDQVIDYVLKRPRKEDGEAIEDAIARALGIIPQVAAGEYQHAMQLLHRQNPEGERKN